MSEATESHAGLRQWLRKAGDDLRAAELIQKEVARDDHWLVMFHAQQAVEKNIKALLVHLDIAFARPMTSRICWRFCRSN